MRIRLRNVPPSPRALQLREARSQRFEHVPQRRNSKASRQSSTRMRKYLGTGRRTARMDLRAHNVLLLSAGMIGVRLSAGAAAANDTAAGGSGSDLVPLEVTDVRMVSEDILIRAVGASWQVQADYVFENLGDRPVELQVGFPEYAC